KSGIVAVYGLGAYADGRPYYAMRLIKGESLEKAIEDYHAGGQGDALGLRRLLTRFVAVCNAVGFAHSRGVIHRDLKPANVMLGEYGETLLVDWGLATRKSDDSGRWVTGEQQQEEKVGSEDLTAVGEVLGTPAYMPPEQARGELDRVGMASDVFSLGATLYCLLTGRSPYHGALAVKLAAGAAWVPARQLYRRVPP